jgi:hypothetical protein
VTESRAVDLEKAGELLKMLEAAEKPVFIAGSGAYYSAAEKEMVEFIEKTGAPGFTSSSGRGVIPDTHPEPKFRIGYPPMPSDALTNVDSSSWATASACIMRTAICSIPRPSWYRWIFSPKRPAETTIIWGSTATSKPPLAALTE